MWEGGAGEVGVGCGVGGGGRGLRPTSSERYVQQFISPTIY